jgi:hypothetical protein
MRQFERLRSTLWPIKNTRAEALTLLRNSMLILEQLALVDSTFAILIDLSTIASCI